jgi:hypothetical protein
MVSGFQTLLNPPPHPPFGHLLLKEKEKGILAFLEDFRGLSFLAVE